MHVKLCCGLVALLFSVVARADDGIEPIADSISTTGVRLSIRIVELDTRGLRDLGFDFVANNRGELRATSEKFVSTMIDALANEHLVHNDAQIILTSADQENCETMVQWTGRTLGGSVARRVALSIRPQLAADQRVQLEIGCVAKADHASTACTAQCAAHCPEKCLANCPEQCAGECPECPDCPASCGGDAAVVLHRGRVAPESMADDTLCFVTDFCDDAECDHEPACGRCFVIVRADWQMPADDCLEARLPRELSRSRHLPEILPEDVLQPLHWELPIADPSVPELLQPAEPLRTPPTPDVVPPAFPTSPFPTSVLPRLDNPVRRFQHTAHFFGRESRRGVNETSVIAEAMPVSQPSHDRLTWMHENFMNDRAPLVCDGEVSQRIVHQLLLAD